MRFLQVLKLPHVAVGIAVQGGLTVKFVTWHLIVFTVEGVLTVGHTVRVRCQHPAVAAGNDLVRVEGDDEVFAAPLQLAQAGTQFGDDGTPFADEMTYWLPVRGFKAIVHTPLWNKLLSLTIVSHKSQDAAAHKDKKIGSPLEGSQRNRTTSGLLRSGPQWCSRRWGRASPSGHQCGRHWPGRSSARRRCHTDARRTVRQWRCSTAKH